MNINYEDFASAPMSEEASLDSPSSEHALRTSEPASHSGLPVSQPKPETERAAMLAQSMTEPLPPIQRTPQRVEFIDHNLIDEHGIPNVLDWLARAREEARRRTTLSGFMEASPRFIALLPSKQLTAERSRMQEHAKLLKRYGVLVFEESDPVLRQFKVNLQKWVERGGSLQPKPAAPAPEAEDTSHPQAEPQLGPEDARHHAKLLRFINRQDVEDDFTLE